MVRRGVVTAPALTLWSNDPAGIDLMSFDAVAGTVADALLDEALAPVALGLSGSWGRASEPGAIHQPKGSA